MDRWNHFLESRLRTFFLQTMTLKLLIFHFWSILKMIFFHFWCIFTLLTEVQAHNKKQHTKRKTPPCQKFAVSNFFSINFGTHCCATLLKTNFKLQGWRVGHKRDFKIQVSSFRTKEGGGGTKAISSCKLQGEQRLFHDSGVEFQVSCAEISRESAKGWRRSPTEHCDELL